jgi:hypothetical protein
VFSCGVPALIADVPDSWTLLALQTAAIPATGLACKSWTEFTRNGAPRMDFVISLDASTFDTHPSWPGQPITALWEYPPLSHNAKKRGNVAVETVQTLMSMRRRIELLVSLHSRSKKRTDMTHDLQDMTHM